LKGLESSFESYALSTPNFSLILLTNYALAMNFKQLETFDNSPNQLEIFVLPILVFNQLDFLF